MKNLTAIILAAGKGTRMKSKYPKVLHKLGGKPMLQHVLDAAAAAGCTKKVVIIGHEAELVHEMVGSQAQVVLQAEQLGTGHAVLQTEQALTGIRGTALILCGDTPLLEGAELKKFIAFHDRSGAAATVMTAMLADPFGYGRILRDQHGNVLGIVEQKDATKEQQALKEINTGIYCVKMPLLFDVLHTLTNNNVQGEYYLTDLLSKLYDSGKKVAGYVTDDNEMVLGINSRRQLAEAESVMRRRVLNNLMDSGVTIMDPASTFIEKTVKIQPDTIIYPYTWLEGQTEIGADCEIGPQVRFSNVKVGSGNQIQFCYGHDCEVKDQTTIGPYVHLRPDTVIGNKVHIGNFVEVKNSTVDTGTKLPHLTYIGDSDIGSGVNMGCGCITVNYDGKVKHRTKIGDRAFVGCNTNLVAPVEVGADTYIGAGSTITKNVPPDALGIGRARQKNIEGWAKKYKERP